MAAGTTQSWGTGVKEESVTLNWNGSDQSVDVVVDSQLSPAQYSFKFVGIQNMKQQKLLLRELKVKGYN